METINIDNLELKALRAGLRGTAYAPGDEGYDGARSAWNLAADQRPALVIMAEAAADIVAAVRLARRRSLGVGVMATGHGAASLPHGGVLINTSRMKGVQIDPVAQTARVEPGVKWKDVIPEAQKFGLAGLLGSTSDVSVTGYTTGGGFAWLGRKYGFNADSVIEAELVTADGELLRVSSEENADLFYGIKGGGGNFGIVTSLEFALYPISHVYGGNIYYPIERAPEVLEHYARWIETLPDEMTTAVVFLNFPPIPEMPPYLRGRSFIAVRGAYSGETPEAGKELMRPWYEGFGEPDVGDMRVIPYAAMDAISMDPVDPIAADVHVERLGELSPEAIAALVEVAGADSGMPSEVLEIRQLGGALGREPTRPSAIGHRDSRFIMTGIGATPTPEVADRVRAHHARVAEVMRPFATGATYVNFLDLERATPERVRAAYSPEVWERLVTLKERYDPDNLFRFGRNIPPSWRRASAA
ncbi:MAG: FAD-binding oxidoreductase [Actinomycetota bacterium]|nr:FAD-binding oxidoreductase [Actinomycetota bacterium]